MKSKLYVISIIGWCVVHIYTGIMLTSIGRRLAEGYDMRQTDLPLITRAAVDYTAGVWPVLVGVVLGMLTLSGLFLLPRPYRWSWPLAWLMIASMVAAMIHQAFVIYGMTLPMLESGKPVPL